ncbi:MAG: hypothetical protein ACYCVD_19045 [Desulfitobacteriaceae bacterium]
MLSWFSYLVPFGPGLRPSVALIMTLPAVSIPSLLIVKRAFPLRVLLFVTGAVALVGVVSAFVALAVF